MIVPRVRRSASSRPDSQSTLAARLTHSVATLVRRSAAGALLALAALLAAPMLGIGGIAHAQTTVPRNWSLTPSGLDPDDQFRLLFVSSTTRDAESTTIGDYDTHVQNAAAAGHADIQAYSAQFKALASTETVDARDNTGTTSTGVPIYWLNGAKVANDYGDFYDGTWEGLSTGDRSRNESGATVTGAIQVWTGTQRKQWDGIQRP